MLSKSYSNMLLQVLGQQSEGRGQEAGSRGGAVSLLLRTASASTLRPLAQLAGATWGSASEVERQEGGSLRTLATLIGATSDHWGSASEEGGQQGHPQRPAESSSVESHPWGGQGSSLDMAMGRLGVRHSRISGIGLSHTLGAGAGRLCGEMIGGRQPLHQDPFLLPHLSHSAHSSTASEGMGNALLAQQLPPPPHPPPPSNQQAQRPPSPPPSSSQQLQCPPSPPHQPGQLRPPPSSPHPSSQQPYPPPSLPSGQQPQRPYSLPPSSGQQPQLYPSTPSTHQAVKASSFSSSMASQGEPDVPLLRRSEQGNGPTNGHSIPVAFGSTESVRVSPHVELPNQAQLNADCGVLLGNSSMEPADDMHALNSTHGQHHIKEAASKVDVVVQGFGHPGPQVSLQITQRWASVHENPVFGVSCSIEIGSNAV